MSFRLYDPSQVGGMLVYQGSRRQRGGNLMETLTRTIGRPLLGHARKIGKDLMKRGVKVGVGAVRDKLRGGPGTMTQALQRRATAAADKAVVDYLGGEDQPDIPFLSQDGVGLRRRRKRVVKRKKPINKAKKKKSINKTAKKKRKPKRKRKSDIFS